MADWNDGIPQFVSTTDIVDLETQFGELWTDCLTLFEGSSSTNIPDKAKRWNESSGQFETWDDSTETWNPLDIRNTIDGKQPATTTSETDGLVYWSSGSIVSPLALAATDDGGIKKDVSFQLSTFLASGPVSSDPNLAFNTWRTPSGTRPTLLIIQVSPRSDSVTTGIVMLEVDDAGGTVGDYTLSARVPPEPSSSVYHLNHQMTTLIRPGASYRVHNYLDPTGNNFFTTHREYRL